jgi:hypothetical protein
MLESSQGSEKHAEAKGRRRCELESRQTSEPFISSHSLNETVVSSVRPFAIVGLESTQVSRVSRCNLICESLVDTMPSYEHSHRC